MNKSRWNRSRVKRESQTVTSKIGDLVMYHWNYRYDTGSSADELCVVVAVDGEVMTIQPVNGECAFLACQYEVSCVK